MSEENVETVRRSFGAFDAGGIEAALRFIAPDAVGYPAPEWIEASEYRGHDGVRFLLSIFTDNIDDYSVDVVEIRDAGDSVVALIQHGGKLKGTDEPIRQPMGMVFSDFREAQIGEARFFQTWREALKAAGLSE